MVPAGYAATQHVQQRGRAAEDSSETAGPRGEKSETAAHQDPVGDAEVQASVAGAVRGYPRDEEV